MYIEVNFTFYLLSYEFQSCLKQYLGWKRLESNPVELLSPVTYEYAPSSVDVPPLPGTTLALSLLAVLNRKLDIDGKFELAVLDAHADKGCQ